MIPQRYVQNLEESLQDFLNAVYREGISNEIDSLSSFLKTNLSKEEFKNLAKKMYFEAYRDDVDFDIKN